MESIDHNKRCFGSHSQIYADYHDTEWGVPVYDDRTLFEMLILEGAHAGLSWETILKKRETYRARFFDFDVIRVAAMSDEELAEALLDPGIVRHRQKIASTRKNAQIFIKMQTENGSFSNWLWRHVDGKPIINTWADFSEVPATTELSDLISKSLKKRGMSFVGPTIIYAYLQAVGVVNDHHQKCWRYLDAR